MSIRPEDLGVATILPNGPVIAGSMGTWEITFTVGKHGIDDGGSVLICGGAATDRERPQFDKPGESGYVTATTTGNARLELRFEPRGYVARPWRGALVVAVRDGSLKSGDVIKIVLGDRTQGGPGLRAQTFAERAHVYKIMVDAFNADFFYEIPNSPSFQIVGGYPAELHIVPPSVVVAGEPFTIRMRAVDTWGNPSSVPIGSVSLEARNECVQLPCDHVEFTSQSNGVMELDACVITETGVYRISGSLEGAHTQATPVRCVGREEISRKDRTTLLWGDLHGQTADVTAGAGSVEEYLAFARNTAFLDFTGWQGNDFNIRPKGWETVKSAFKRHNDPGRFVAFLGYEWSGLTPSGGDYNIHFLRDDEPINRSNQWLIPQHEQEEDTDRYPISELWQSFAGRSDVFAVPHVGGRYANLDFFDPAFSPVVEIHSHHGTFEWLIEEAFRRGLRVGFSGGGDDHTCRPGLSYPTLGVSHGSVSFDVQGGYTAVFTDDRTRQGIRDALFRRHCYATTGVRLLLSVTCNGAMMGDELRVSEPLQLEVAVHGTAPLLEVQVYRGVEMIHRAPLRKPTNEQDRRILVLWSGVRVKSRAKKSLWNGTLFTEGGYMVECRPVAFERGSDTLTALSNQLLHFESSTSGDVDGLLLKVRGRDANLQFTSPHVQFELPVSEIGWEPHTFAAGGVNQQVVVAESSATGPLDYSFGLEGIELAPGVNPLWIRVIQEDGHMAWSSPIYAVNSEVTV